MKTSTKVRTTKKTTTNTRTTTSKEPNDLELIIDSKPNEGDDKIFYLLPSEMSKSGILNPGKFTSCTIRNVDSDDIRPSALLGIYTSLKPEGEVNVTIRQPIAVMQPYEARMIEANARLAGFTEIRTKKGTFFNDYSKQDDETLCVTFVKPARV